MAKSRSRDRRERAEAPEFIKVWQTSRTRQEVASRLGMTKDAVRTRAWRYRQLGVPLKELPPDGMFGWSWNWDVLAKDATKFLKEHEASKAAEGELKGEGLADPDAATPGSGM